MNKDKYRIFYAVTWTKKARKEYGVSFKNIIIGTETRDDIKVVKKTGGRPIIRYADNFAIFETKKEAEAYRQGNKDWRISKILIEFLNKDFNN